MKHNELLSQILKLQKTKKIKSLCNLVNRELSSCKFSPPMKITITITGFALELRLVGSLAKGAILFACSLQK